jgi:hypothetical protein
MPLAAPVTAATVPRIAVMVAPAGWKLGRVVPIQRHAGEFSLYQIGTETIRPFRFLT